MTNEVEFCTGLASGGDSASTCGNASLRTAGSIVEKVAVIISGISVIGQARNELEAAGWQATIAGNRITVADDVSAQLIPAKIGSNGSVEASWIVSSITGAHPASMARGQACPTISGSEGDDDS